MDGGDIEPSGTALRQPETFDHFPDVSATARQEFFERAPGGVEAGTGPVDGLALGATLYIPGIEPGIFAKLGQTLDIGALAAVICLEDSVRLEDVPAAEVNVVTSLRRAAADPSIKVPPLLFLRPRTPEQLISVGRDLGSVLPLLRGICVPKFSSRSGEGWLSAVDLLADELGHHLSVMPILEGPAALHRESRLAEFLTLRSVLLDRKEHVPVVRIGGTDLCGLLGLRRRADETIYDLGPVRDAILDMVNVFTRNDDFLVSGPVWEYFHSDERLWKPQLRTSLFDSEGADLRSSLISRHLDGLIKEVLADRANGLTGKTVIHPSHIRPVNALHTVTFEEWVDASNIMSSSHEGGVQVSAFSNKMNEAGPHRLWAERVLAHGQVFGVLHEGTTFVSLLDS